MSTVPTPYVTLLEEVQRVQWAFGLTLPPHPEGDGTDYVCPAEAYLACIRVAVTALATAREAALAEIPERITARGAWLEQSHLSAVEEMSTVAPEVRRLWAVKAALAIVENLYDALVDEARPQPRVELPKLARTRRR